MRTMFVVIAILCLPALGYADCYYLGCTEGSPGGYGFESQQTLPYYRETPSLYPDRDEQRRFQQNTEIYQRQQRARQPSRLGVQPGGSLFGGFDD